MTVEGDIGRRSEALLTEGGSTFSKLPYSQLPESIHQMAGFFGPLADEDLILMGIGDSFIPGHGKTYHYIFHIPARAGSRTIRVFLNPDDRPTEFRNYLNEDLDPSRIPSQAQVVLNDREFKSKIFTDLIPILERARDLRYFSS